MKDKFDNNEYHLTITKYRRDDDGIAGNQKLNMMNAPVVNDRLMEQTNNASLLCSYSCNCRCGTSKPKNKWKKVNGHLIKLDRLLRRSAWLAQTKCTDLGQTSS